MQRQLAKTIFITVLLLMLPIARCEGREREATFPLKDRRALLTDQQIRQARQNCAIHAGAKRIAAKVTANADKWLKWSDEDMRALITTSRVPRAFNVSTAGCPIHGKAIYKHGTYPWIIEATRPFKVKCPVGGEVYPGNDYAAFYRSGLKDEQFLEGDHSDDGWGWKGPDGDLYWFVAYANHWMWRDHILPAVLDLSRAYVLTGDKRYAHKAIIVLDRIAEVYPDMDYHNQSRYGSLQKRRRLRYGGKILSHIWETSTLRDLAESYDAVWETVDTDTAAQKLIGKTGKQIRAGIEKNILEEGIEAYLTGDISGNFGMHQNALLYAVTARQYGEVDRWIDGILNNAGPSLSHLGLNYALYNLVYRDGLPFETSPAYNWTWVENIASLADILKTSGRNIYNNKVKLLFDGKVAIEQLGAFDPSVGDSGTVYGRLYGQNSGAWRSAWRNYRDSRYLGKFSGFTDYRSLFYRPVQSEIAGAPAQSSRLLDGYGMAVLRNPANSVSLALYYGLRGGHGHYDRLSFELFAGNQPMMPDLGYPDFMNAYVSGIFTWSKNTISHNTVTVDARRQAANYPGRVESFIETDFVRLVDVDASATYPQCPVYRRQVIMVDVDKTKSYFVDVFTVRGGAQHDYSLHGPPGPFKVSGGAWRKQTAGTLAGASVPVGRIYDSATMGAENYRGAFAGYGGSGFQHLFNVRCRRGGPWFAGWSHEKNKNAGLRIRMIDRPEHEVILAKAHISPVRQQQLLDYIIVRHKGQRPLKSRFVSLIEPFSTKPFVKSVTPLAINSHAVLGIAVELENGDVDVILYDPGQTKKMLKAYDLSTDSACVVLRLAPGGVPSRLFFAKGSFVQAGKHRIKVPQAIKGRVISVDPDAGQVKIRLDDTAPPPGVEGLVGRVAHFANSLRTTAHPIEKARFVDGDLLLTTKDALAVGRAKIKRLASDTVYTDTAFKFADTYSGAYTTDEDFSEYHQIRSVSKGRIDLSDSVAKPHLLASGKDVWVINVGPADEMEIDTGFSLDLSRPNP